MCVHAVCIYGYNVRRLVQKDVINLSADDVDLRLECTNVKTDLKLHCAHGSNAFLSQILGYISYVFFRQNRSAEREAQQT